MGSGSGSSGSGCHPITGRSGQIYYMKIGKVSENIIKRSVLKVLDKKSAAPTSDCALFTGYVANEISGKSGTHALIRAVNRAVESGYKPIEASVNVTMPEYLREKRLKEIMSSVAGTAGHYDISVTSGHSETVDGLKYPIVTVTLMAQRTGYHTGITCAEAGMGIVMTKWAALSGTAWIASQHGKAPAERFPSFLMEDALYLDNFISVTDEALVAAGCGNVSMYACSDGGVFAGLWKLADRAGLGLAVDLRSIPIRQETVELCEFYDINPYMLKSDGALLIATFDTEALIKALTDKEIPSALIGHLTEGKDRVILSGEDRRFLEEPSQDEQVKVLCYNVADKKQA